MELEKGISVCSHQLSQVAADIAGGFNMNHVIGVSADGSYTADFLQQCFQLFIAGGSLKIKNVQPFILQLLSQFIDLSAGDQMALDKDSDAVADLLNLIKLMRGNQDSPPVLNGKLTNQGNQLTHAFRVNTKSWFVHNDYFWILHQNVCDTETLFHTSGIAAGFPVSRIGHAYTFKKFACPVMAQLCGKAVQAAGQLQVFAAGQVRVEADMIRQITDDPFDGKRISGTVAPIDYCGAGGGFC